MRGTYCLLINCRKPQSIRIGMLGIIDFRKGFYIYVGSALNGIEKRVLRHLRKRKNKFWHIDYLLSSKHVHIDRIYCIESNKNMECNIAEEFEAETEPIAGFGSSDCKCRSHLFFICDWKRKAG